MSWRDHVLRPTAPPLRLGLFRVLLGCFILDDMWRAQGSTLRLHLAGPAQWSPAGVMQFTGELPPFWVVEAGFYTTAVLFVLWVLGLGWRLVGPAAALALLTLWSYRLSWGMVYHNFHLAALHVLVLGFMPSAAGFSLDAAIGGRWRRWAGWAPDGAEEWSGRTLQIATLIATLTYLVAGVAKVRANLGWAWVSGQNLLDQIGYDALYKDVLSYGGGPHVPWLYEHAWLLGPLAGISLVLELFAPLALLHRRLGQFWAVNTWCMHLGIGVLMTIWFRYPTSFIAFLTLFPLELYWGWGASAVRRAVALVRKPATAPRT